MSYNIMANCPVTKKTLATINFGNANPLSDQFFTLLGVSKTAVRRMYTVSELRTARKFSVNIIKDIDNRREVKSFLTACIDQATGEIVDIWFA